jgi:hypothetical protein
MKRASSGFAVGLVTLVIAACGGEVDTTVDTAAGTAAQPPAAAAPSTPAEVNLAAINNSGVSGTARLEHAGDSVRISLTMSGLQSGTQYRGHLHRGTCGTDRGRAASMESFTVSTGTNGQTVASFPRSMFDATEREYFIEVHGANDVVIACGNLPAGSHIAPTS